MAYKPISDYGIIGNMISAALVARDGSIDWCCLPRFDSPSVFAAILDDEKGGQFTINPQKPFEFHQAYLPNTNVLQTTFNTETGAVTLNDFMPCYLDTKGNPVEVYEIHRIVKCSQGEVPMEVTFTPRMDYARGETRLFSSELGITAKRETETLTLSSSVSFGIDKEQGQARFTLRQGQEAAFVLHHGLRKPLSVSQYNSAEKLEKTTAYWKHLAEECVFGGPWRDSIVRSYLTLHLLIYSPTGGIIAAPTTSLPEKIGGERNWDYRFTWFRDASLTLNGFLQLGHKEDAMAFMKWLMKVCASCGPRAQILYDVDFEDPIEEQTLDHLKGYRNSRPVRIGNAASKQLQLDIFGEILETAHNYVKIDGDLSNENWKLLETFVEAACELWQQPDYGIWEIRGDPHHYVHSKFMCWVALDRGISIAEKLGQAGNLERWRKTRDMIKDDILMKGWNPKKQAFTQHYDTEELDASNLLMPLFGFLPVSDERMSSTIERTVEELSWNGLLRRYKAEEVLDGIEDSEGAFLWCSFWLVRNLLRMNKLDDAIALYEKLLGYRNHLGLLSEMVDPLSGEALGNFPQALSHLAVIIAGQELTRAMDGEKV